MEKYQDFGLMTLMMKLDLVKNMLRRMKGNIRRMKLSKS